MLGRQHPLSLGIQQGSNHLLQLLWYLHRKTRWGIGYEYAGKG
jgi:hypothetical protein